MRRLPCSFNDITGQRFGRWLVVHLHSRDPIRWLCRCDCGTERAVKAGELRTGHSRSCGCYHQEVRTRSMPIEDRLWSRVDKTPDGCWVWLGPTNRSGYGEIGRDAPSGGTVRVHRLSYQLAYGSIPDGQCVLHRCDNRPCVRPDHLWLGTQSDNNADMVAKGRARFWGNRPRAK